MSDIEVLSQLSAGMKVLVGGNRAAVVSDELARDFRPGDRLCVVNKTGQLLHIKKEDSDLVDSTVGRTVRAFRQMSQVRDEQISIFFEQFADRLADDRVWAQVASVNLEDIAQAKSRGRSTTRLEATEVMRLGMIDGLRGWARADSMRGKVIETVDHGSWKAELVRAELGVVAFVFEGRPNVVADATGVLRGGNTVVFRIGRDALETAKAIIRLATRPALAQAGLPEDAVSVVDSASHAAGWALFGDHRLALAVARGSGPAVDTLGSIAQSAGVPVSLHGTGGAWLMVGASASAENLTNCVADSLDRKVCNTLNTCCIQQKDAAHLVPAFLEGLKLAGKRRGTTYKLHVTAEGASHVPAELFETFVSIDRAEGTVQESQAELIGDDRLGQEWEWENTPEVTLKIVSSLGEAVELFNAQSPQFVCTLLSDELAEREEFWTTVNAPFVGDGFTRWVDGQYALKRPELGLSNWENGRLFGRGGVLSGDSVYTVRTRVSGTRTGRPS
jgi:glutamate-5-semialdehyde dehydrogenase